MKKTIVSMAFMAAAIFAASCQKENLQENTSFEGSASVFSATIETGANTKTTVERVGGTTATYKTKWESTDKISINGTTYTAVPDDVDATRATFIKDSGNDPTGTFKAYFPAGMYSNSKATLPANYTYANDKYNMPMYAQSTTASLHFKNLCGVLAITVSGVDFTSVSSIEVSSDQQMNGEFEATAEGVLTFASVALTDALKKVTLNISPAKTIAPGESATFYIPVPAGTHNLLTIKVSDETTITKAMVALKSGGAAVARNTVYPITFADNLPRTGLPVLVLNTINAEPIVSKDNWIEGAIMSILNADMTIDYQGTLSIKGRGNTTWDYPKKPYALKLDDKSKILGMPKHKRWCLLANWMDRTMIRNAVAFEIARKCPGLEWTPRGEFVEVILNGTHIGNYYLCEQIKVDENRVDIEELDNTVTEGDGITGGFIMELDTYYDEVNKFKSARRNLPWMFKDPDDVNSAQLTYMKNYVNAMENALYDDSKFASREFVNYMDLESFVDYWFVYELAMNRESLHPKSVYMHKDKNGVIKAGPVWDFDWGTFTPAFCLSFNSNNALYYGRLFEDAGFRSLVKSRWQELKPEFEEIGQFIMTMGGKLSESDKLNHTLWPIISSNANGDESMNYSVAISRMKDAYMNQLNWMDTQISSW